MKKRMFSLLLALIMVAGLLPAAVTGADAQGETGLPFTDVPADAWYLDAIRYVYANGLMIGTGATTFEPDTTITRGMIVTILHRLEGTPKAEGMTFSDVEEGKWYSDGVAWASANGIVNGFPEGTFEPKTPITREQLATTLYRYANFKGMDVSVGEDTNILSYDDAFEIDDWAMPAMQWVCGAGLLPGLEESDLRHAEPATRAETAALFMNLLAPKPQEPEQEQEESKDTVRVKFDYNDGSGRSPLIVEVVRGETVKPPEDPTKPAHSFIGWYTEPVNGRKFDFSTPVDQDMTLYAQWSGYSNRYYGGGASGGEPRPEPSPDPEPEPEAESVILDPYELGVDDPVYFDMDDTEKEGEEKLVFKNADCEEIVVTEDSVIELTITQEKVTAEDRNVDGEAVMETLAETAGELNISFNELKSSIRYTAVEVSLILVTTVTDEESGEETTTEEELHPVGRTTVSLTAEEIGLTQGTDLENYVFFAIHTNIDGVEENVPGVVVEVGGVQKVRFVLNGLSRIVIGSVPPCTVTFETNGGTPVPDEQLVKFGDYIRPVADEPCKIGYTFTRWSVDLQTTKVFSDMTVTAVYDIDHSIADVYDVEPDTNVFMYVPGPDDGYLNPSGYALLNDGVSAYYYVYLNGDRTKAYLESQDELAIIDGAAVKSGFYLFAMTGDDAYLITPVNAGRCRYSADLTDRSVHNGKLYAFGSDGAHLDVRLVDLSGDRASINSLDRLEELLHEGFTVKVDYMFEINDDGDEIPIGVMYITEVIPPA